MNACMISYGKFLIYCFLIIRYITSCSTKDGTTIQIKRIFRWKRFCVQQVRNLFVNMSDWEFSNIQYKVSEKSYCRGSQIFQKPRNHLQILAARSVTFKKYHTQDSQHWSELWTLLLSGAFCLVHVNWYTFLYVRIKTEIIHSFIPLACAECNDSLPLSRVSSSTLCYVVFPTTLLHQLFFHPLSPHLAIYFLVYLSILSFPNSYIIIFGEFMPKPM